MIHTLPAGTTTASCYNANNSSAQKRAVGRRPSPSCHTMWRSARVHNTTTEKASSDRLICCNGLVNRLQNVASTDSTSPSFEDWDQQSRLLRKLQSIIAANSLEAFYPTEGKKLQAVLAKLMTVDFRQLAAEWRVPVEMAYDLATLALYDIVIFADDSGSMAMEEKGQRIDDLEYILGRVAEVATMFDDTGISVRFMNSNIKGDGIKSAQQASQLLKRIKFTGQTPLGTNLYSKIIKPFVQAGVEKNRLSKPILIITITDGEPTGEPANTTFQAISDIMELASDSQYGPNAVAFQFAQVGRDTRAQAFLERLDNHPVVGDMVDATSYFELEAEECVRKGITLTPELWLIKLMVGAVDPYYDAQDEWNLERSISNAKSWLGGLADKAKKALPS